MEEQLSLEFLRVVENGAIAAARTMGFGDRHKADEVAVEAMRKTMDAVQMDGTIVIGEGERDEAPMLYIGEKVGLATHAPKALFPEVDIAVDPLRSDETGAMAAARTRVSGDRHKADEVAVEAMRKTMDAVQMDGTIVIGEGERDEAPMLYIGEKVGLATHAPKALFPEVDIAVDPLEGTNLCATGAAGAIAV